jgi:malate synthase
MDNQTMSPQPEPGSLTGLRLLKTVRTPAEQEILSTPALQFLHALATRFEPVRQQMLESRARRLAELRAGKTFNFLESTASVRAHEWQVAPIPPELADRRVEITGPVDRKMVINALNSGASAFMADFEDSNSPTWQNCVEGQLNLRDAVRGTISFASPEGKQYRLNPNPAVLFVRPRGWHLTEKHVLVDGQPMSASLFDFGLFFFHNVEALVSQRKRPCFYLPKMESHLEARLWDNVFEFAESHLDVPKGTIRATVLIETLPAAFEMDEILHELRNHSAGLNCGRWDYIFSFIKKFSHRADCLLPDRSLVTMDKHFLKSYVELLIYTCHRRGIHAMGGMAAQIPIKNDPAANDAAFAKVRQDKLREVTAGHDGTWVAHPGLVAVAKGIFDENMPQANQISRLNRVSISSSDLLAVPTGEITEKGLEMNIDIGLQYLESWLNGNGCVPIYNLMEDAATAEISRAQLWQWAHHNAPTASGNIITVDSVVAAIPAVLDKLRTQLGAQRFDSGNFTLAAQMFADMTRASEFPEFLTTVAYQYID